MRSPTIWEQKEPEPAMPTYVRVVLVREKEPPYGTLRQSDDAAEILRPLIEDSPREVFLALLLDSKHRVNAVHRVSEGRIDSTAADPREVFQAAILANATCVILAHNHPSGQPEPSPEDIALTRRLCTAGRILGIGVLDHIVIGHGRHVSLRAQHPDLRWDGAEDDVAVGGVVGRRRRPRSA